MTEDSEKKKNREETKKRSRMWQVVGEDDEDSYRSESDVSSVSDSSSSSSSSTSKRKHHHKKHKKKHKKDAKSEKKEKKEKKHKKDKKKRKKDKKKSSEKSAINQNEYGKYGIIREEHYFQKQREFEAYIFEVKKLPGLFGQPKSEIMKYFRSYVEDFNTATMPHEKYYNLDKWEMEQHAKKQNKKARKALDSEDIPEVFNDEAAREKERREAREFQEKKEFGDILQSMATDKERRADMRRQGELRTQLQIAYRQGDMTTVRRLEKLLAPDEGNAMSAKHPWSS